MKICSKCCIEKDLNEFSKCKRNKDGLQYQCKECVSEYAKKYYKENQKKIAKNYQNNKEQILKKIAEFYQNNKEKFAKRDVKYYKKNVNIILKQKREYRNSKASYDTYASQISYADKVRNIDGFLQVKCTYCGKWYYPTVQEIQNRIQALNEQQSGEMHLYCSAECKKACPIYRRRLYQVGHPMKCENLSREVQPELRKIVLERDEYICIRCGKSQDDLDVALHCHHMEGIQQNPIESADIDMCVTVCKDCHVEIHKQEDCGYSDMKCRRD